MKNDAFESGPWTGFYLYVPGGEKHRMDMELTFKDGLVNGAGADDVGPFTIRGHYDAATHGVTWTKAYAAHTVFYRGCREPIGIWGTWEMELMSGGFHIWPRGEGEGLHLAVEEQTPVNAPRPHR